MIHIIKHWEHFALSIALAGGMTVFAGFAEAHVNWQANVRSAQQQLKNDGYYTGAVDGIDGPMTHSAIRKYQTDNRLAVNGRLDQATRMKLGRRHEGAANREATAGEMRNTSSGRQAADNSNMAYTTSRSNIESAQRQLQQKRFYNGAIDGEMGPKTEAAIRHFQRSNGLNVNGRLDHSTRGSLGIANSQ